MGILRQSPLLPFSGSHRMSSLVSIRRRTAFCALCPVGFQDFLGTCRMTSLCVRTLALVCTFFCTAVLGVSVSGMPARLPLHHLPLRRLPLVSRMQSGRGEAHPRVRERGGRWRGEGGGEGSERDERSRQDLVHSSPGRQVGSHSLITWEAEIRGEMRDGRREACERRGVREEHMHACLMLSCW